MALCELDSPFRPSLSTISLPTSLTMANLGPIHHVTHHVNPTPHAPPANLIHPPTPSMLASSTSFVQAHKKALLVGAGAVAVAAAGYYYYTSTQTTSRPSSSPSDLEKGTAGGATGTSSSKKKKKKSAADKKKSVNDPDGPLLQEAKPKKEDKPVAAAEDESKPVEKKSDGQYIELNLTARRTPGAGLPSTSGLNHPAACD